MGESRVSLAAPSRPRSLAWALFAAVRPLQWLKNGIILVPAVFSLHGTQASAMARALAAVVVFCALSSAAYLVNDLADRERDRAHPEKRLRPIAAGEVTVSTARNLALLLAAGGLALAWLVAPGLFAVSLGYLALQAAYSAVLKQLAIVDVFAIGAGFMLRVMAGAESVAVPISNWLYLTTLFLSLFLALEKRRAELTQLGGGAGGHRANLVEYDVGLVDQLVSIAASGTVLTYALYTLAPDTLARFGTDRLRLTIPLVLFGVCRYLYLVHRRGAGGQPERVLVQDGALRAVVLAYSLVVFWALYLKPA